MSYAEWIEVTIQISSAIGAAVIRNTKIRLGKFYRVNKDTEVPPKEIDLMNIYAGSPVIVSACGWENSASGTQGSFDIFDGAAKMGTFWWDAPWAPGAANTWGFNPASDVYVGQVTGGHSSAPEIGSVKLRLTKF